MKLGARRPGSSTVFLDSASNEALLEISWDADGNASFAYRIYDAAGRLVACSDDPVLATAGIVIAAADGEVLLEVPGDADRHIRYRLYNRLGQLVTCSDGVRTQIFGHLKMDARKAR